MKIFYQNLKFIFEIQIQIMAFEIQVSYLKKKIFKELKFKLIYLKYVLFLLKCKHKSRKKIVLIKIYV